MPDSALDRVYAEAHADEVFFVEYEGLPAAAGDLRDLVALTPDGKDPHEFLIELRDGFMGAIVDLCVLGEKTGDRAESCRSAWDAFKKLRATGAYPKVTAVREELGMPAGPTHELGTF